MNAQAEARPSVLVVEDDENLRLPLVDNLDDEGYAVEHVANGKDAISVATAHEPDIIILDIMLPDIDGYAVCRKLRDAGVKSSVLMLTARTLEDDLVAGFDAGADDYLAKPYRLRELLARVKALARRRGGAPSSAPEELAGIAIDRRARTVIDREGKHVELTRTEFDLLIFFIDHVGEALSRHLILDEVWGTDVTVDPRTVDNFVSNLKRKLGWQRGCGFSFRSVRGVGYRLEVDRR